MESQKEEQQIKGERLAYRFSIEEKKEAVRAVERGELVKSVIARYRISDKTLANWRNRYSQTHKPVAHRVYKFSEKRSVLRAIEKGMSVSDAAIAFGIRNSGSIREWIKQTTAENADLSAIAMKKAQPQESKEQDLETLRQQLAEAQLKIKALETLIDVAEEHLKIDIRKKPGARQSPK
ncbi:transposase [Pedobacter sp. SYSU D00535]|uniref:transposase n=1 Tax=Pedobacter sp. SYSU D00535 TaxID=2810308 RepID=UPI001A96A802|nr:transposase [Pedobacter sp. SYSU D00535]